MPMSSPGSSSDGRFAPFIRQLHADLALPLPGRAAQFRMAPHPVSRTQLGRSRYEVVPADARRGGVLALFYPWQETVYLPFILRPEYNGVHSSQVAFPGGGFEAEDGDLTRTALREAYEEVGIHSDQVKVLGTLSPLYVYASNYLVLPTVAWCDERPNFRVDPYEVAALIETPLAELMDPVHRREEEWDLRSERVRVPYYLVQEHIIWGATAMMLSELLALPALTLLPAAPSPPAKGR